MSAESIRVMLPLFQEDEGGSTPTSALSLVVGRILPETARALNRYWHSRLPRIDFRVCEICYGAEHGGLLYAVAIWSHPAAPQLPQREWLELRRLAIAPDAPRNTGSRLLAIMARLIRKECPWVKNLVSYQDTEVHSGAIYRAAGWKPTRLATWKTWHQPGRLEKNGRPRLRPKAQSTAPKQRWEKSLT